MIKQIPESVRRLFWDIDVNQLDPHKNPEYVIGRILEHGDIEAVRWMFQAFDPELIKKTLSNKKGFSRVSANFWRLFFDLSEKDILCLRTPYQRNQKTHWPY